MLNWQWKFADEYEDCGDWISARSYMYKEWINDKYNIKKLLRLSFLCWIVVIDVGHLVDERKINKKEFEQTLKEIFNFGLKFFRNNVHFLWLYGYMISITPSLFGEESMFEQVGKQWTYEAYLKVPQDPIIKGIFLQGIEPKFRDRLGYKQVCREIMSIINDNFKGNGYMQKYFRSLFLAEVLSED
ncbi:hypothetical protein [Romboutsia sp.]|uniref:hypothetical protein n=1 Tax=Romboutsia sp. TaxID=1965302 RepID=UPI002C7A4ACA|nr:hypothetical protein [Romboutsia sp.]HSQ89260.1 hypothetical protein [Romboutsia sp.]